MSRIILRENKVAEIDLKAWLLNTNYKNIEKILYIVYNYVHT